MIKESRNNKNTRNNYTRLVSRTFFVISVLMLCSCASSLKQYNLAFDGAPRPGEEAILTVRPQTGSLSVGATQMPLVESIDDSNSDRNGSKYGYACIFNRPFEVRLLPGSHKICVSSGGGGAHVCHYKPIVFDAVSGNHYDLKLEVARVHDYGVVNIVRWQAKVIEIETGKEFVMDATQ